MPPPLSIEGPLLNNLNNKFDIRFTLGWQKWMIMYKYEDVYFAETFIS